MKKILILTLSFLISCNVFSSNIDGTLCLMCHYPKPQKSLFSSKSADEYLFNMKQSKNWKYHMNLCQEKECSDRVLLAAINYIRTLS